MSSIITERTVLGALTVLEDGQIQVRTDTILERDGVKLAHTYHRHVVAPDMDPTDFLPRLRQLCRAMWTPDVVAAYERAKAEQAQHLP